jgi:hypothetical protein
MLPILHDQNLTETLAYLRDVALALGKFQQVFLPVEEHDWQRGLVVVESGVATQPFIVDGLQLQAVLDMKAGLVRIGEARWPLIEYSAQEIFNNLHVWLEAHNVGGTIQMPEFATLSVSFDPAQAAQIVDCLYWFDTACQRLQTSYDDGLVSPILVFPHHFDLSLVWFPHHDERQIGVGFSFGDENIAEPYIYITAYPDFTQSLQLVEPGFEQTAGFHGAVLRYHQLQSVPNPELLFDDFATSTTQQLLSLLG